MRQIKPKTLFYANKKTIKCVFAPLHPFLLNAVAKNIKKFVPDNSNQSFLNPAICQEKFCREWVQIRKYPACVVCMPILLRICLSGSAYELQTFLDKLPDSKEVTRITRHKLF